MDLILNSISEETETMTSTLEVNSQNKDDNVAQEQGEGTQQELNTSNAAQKEVTPKKTQEEVKVPAMTSDLNVGQANPSKKSEDAKEAELPETDRKVLKNDRFLTPIRKHQVLAASAMATATAMEGVIETENPYTALTSLGSTQNQRKSPKMSPSSESPQKKKAKVSPAFMKVMDEAVAKKQEALKNGLTQKLPGKEDVAVTLLGNFGGAVKAVASPVTRLGTDEEIQESFVTGEINWQDSLEKSYNIEEYTPLSLLRTR
jgi:hypothetical protein